MSKIDWVQTLYNTLFSLLPPLHTPDLHLLALLRSVHTLTQLESVKEAEVDLFSPVGMLYGNEAEMKYEVWSGPLISPGL